MGNVNSMSILHFTNDCFTLHFNLNQPKKRAHSQECTNAIWNSPSVTLRNKPLFLKKGVTPLLYNLHFCVNQDVVLYIPSAE